MRPRQPKMPIKVGASFQHIGDFVNRGCAMNNAPLPVPPFDRRGRYLPEISNYDIGFAAVQCQAGNMVRNVFSRRGPARAIYNKFITIPMRFEDGGGVFVEASNSFEPDAATAKPNWRRQ